MKALDDLKGRIRHLDLRKQEVTTELRQCRTTQWQSKQESDESQLKLKTLVLETLKGLSALSVDKENEESPGSTRADRLDAFLSQSTQIQTLLVDVTGAKAARSRLFKVCEDQRERLQHSERELAFLRSRRTSSAGGISVLFPHAAGEVFLPTQLANAAARRLVDRIMDEQSAPPSLPRSHSRSATPGFAKSASGVLYSLPEESKACPCATLADTLEHAGRSRALRLGLHALRTHASMLCASAAILGRVRTFLGQRRLVAARPAPRRRTVTRERQPPLRPPPEDVPLPIREFRKFLKSISVRSAAEAFARIAIDDRMRIRISRESNTTVLSSSTLGLVKPHGVKVFSFLSAMKELGFTGDAFAIAEVLDSAKSGLITEADFLRCLQFPASPPQQLPAGRRVSLSRAYLPLRGPSPPARPATSLTGLRQRLPTRQGRPATSPVPSMVLM